MKNPNELATKIAFVRDKVCIRLFERPDAISNNKRESKNIVKIEREFINTNPFVVFLKRKKNYPPENPVSWLHTCTKDDGTIVKITAPESPNQDDKLVLYTLVYLIQKKMTELEIGLPTTDGASINVVDIPDADKKVLRTSIVYKAPKNMLVESCEKKDWDNLLKYFYRFADFKVEITKRDEGIKKGKKILKQLITSTIEEDGDYVTLEISKEFIDECQEEFLSYDLSAIKKLKRSQNAISLLDLVKETVKSAADGRKLYIIPDAEIREWLYIPADRKSHHVKRDIEEAFAKLVENNFIKVFVDKTIGRDKLWVFSMYQIDKGRLQAALSE